jgi:hypothetical protein
MHSTPVGLSLSKPCTGGGHFDKLSANGYLMSPRKPLASEAGQNGIRIEIRQVSSARADHSKPNLNAYKSKAKATMPALAGIPGIRELQSQFGFQLALV